MQPGVGLTELDALALKAPQILVVPCPPMGAARVRCSLLLYFINNGRLQYRKRLSF